jgi:hypothetical protein
VYRVNYLESPRKRDLNSNVISTLFIRMVVWRGKSKKQFRSNFIHRVALKNLEMMILIILDSKIIKMVIMAEWENLGATRKVHNATLLDLIISEISLLPSSPPCSLHIVTN